MKIAVVCSGLSEEIVQNEFGKETVVLPSNESGAAVFVSPRSSTGREKAQEILREIIRRVQSLIDSDEALESVRVILELDDYYSPEDAIELLVDAGRFLNNSLYVYESDGVFCSYEYWVFNHSRRQWKRLGL